MPATLKISFDEQGGAEASYYDGVREALGQAFAAWMSHFDHSQGEVTVDVRFEDLPGAVEANIAPHASYVVGTAAGAPVSMSGFALTAVAGATGLDASATLRIDTEFLAWGFPTSGPAGPYTLMVMAHELGHALAFNRLVSGSSSQTTFEHLLHSGPSGTETFNGAHAVASYGGPVPMEPTTVMHTYTPGRSSVMSYLETAATIQPLDVAILRDSGLPALSDRELREHEVIRLYAAAFGRDADGAGLAHWTRALQGGLPLSEIASSLAASDEFRLRRGAGLDDKAFVDALYRDVLGRDADPAGEQGWMGALAAGRSRADVLLGFSDSDEVRANFSRVPNLAYGETVEAQVQRLYDTAFGREPDPAGFNAWTSALIGGVPLQRAAAGFMASAEFTDRYGAQISDRELVDAFYLHALHRAAEPDGERAWVGALAAGGSRWDVLVGISESREHLDGLVAREQMRDSSGFVADAVVHLGEIPVFWPWV